MLCCRCRTRRIIIATVFVVLLVLALAAGIALLFAPRFLAYADKPVKSDAVILFCGGDTQARMREAEELLKEGQARYVLIPALGEIHSISDDGHVRRLSQDYKVGRLLLKLRKQAYYERYYENTHIEALEAKRMMKELGLRSAILVSSPYHMRRIHMISQKVFGAQSPLISCVPTRYERKAAVLTSMNAADWKQVAEEFIKICWLSLYSHFL